MWGGGEWEAGVGEGAGGSVRILFIKFERVPDRHTGFLSYQSSPSFHLSFLPSVQRGRIKRSIIRNVVVLVIQ